MDLIPGRFTIDPFFIVYKSRSGSTFLADLLVRHADIGIAPESKIIPLTLRWGRRGNRTISNEAQLHNLFDVLYAEPKFESWNLSRVNLREHIIPRFPIHVSDFLRETIALYCRSNYPDCRVIGIKKGGWYTENVRLLKRMFPRSKFIHIIRDGRAVFASSKRAIHTDRGLPFETTASISALRWKRTVKAFERHEGADYAMEVRYETLIARTKDTVARILKFLEVRSDSDTVEQLLMPREAAFVDARNAYLHKNVGAEPKRSRINAWQDELTEAEIESFERIAGPTLMRKGYQVGTGYTNGDKAYEMRVRISELLCKFVGSRSRSLDESRKF